MRMKRMEQMFLQLKAVEAVMERYQERETAMSRMQSLLLATDVLKTAFDDRQTLVAEVSGVTSCQCCQTMVCLVNCVSLLFWSVNTERVRECVIPVPSPHLLAAQLRHLQQLGEADPFIRTVVASLPSTTLATGAASERQLLRSFATVKAAARRVAHVPEHGGFWSYVTSYVISYASFEPKGMVSLLGRLRLGPCVAIATLS
jgi:hypothetical protein